MITHTFMFEIFIICVCVCVCADEYVRLCVFLEVMGSDCVFGCCLVNVFLFSIKLFLKYHDAATTCQDECGCGCHSLFMYMHTQTLIYMSVSSNVSGYVCDDLCWLYVNIYSFGFEYHF